MSFVNFDTDWTEVNSHLMEIGIWKTFRNLSLRFPSPDLLPQRIAITDIIKGRPSQQSETVQAEARAQPEALLTEVNERASAKFSAHREDRKDCENSLAYNERGYARHVLDEGFLKVHVWEACLRPFAIEEERENLFWLDPGQIPNWLKIIPTEAKPQQELYGCPDAIVGLRLTAEQAKVVGDMQINVESDLGPASDPSASLDPTFLPLMVCMTLANWQRPCDPMHPESTLLLDRACVRTYAAMVGMRKFYHAANELAQKKNKQLPPQPPLLLPIFIDNYLTIWALEWVPEAERLPNKGLPYRCVMMEMIHMLRNYEHLTILHVWQVRKWAAVLLRTYLEALAEL
ncbi:hypothetical protein OC846_005148 [Tilletia horrida]|uniref:Uncharacterized protein n=1 Tax=Tilletia horrida TaxID=155126 RepID=A0AAN6JQI7_9BASI|nr:hypothetical protein OC846_005148 [Tilletia horrida]KAK0569582.1 hypothetical protein OC861_000762 [Tilletia horrida]